LTALDRQHRDQKKKKEDFLHWYDFFHEKNKSKTFH